MYADRSILGVVTARGGSKGLPRKNILEVGGKPMIAWSIEAGRTSRHLDRTVVSTDDAEIAAIAKDWGGDVPFLRPAALAGDDSSIYDALLHAMNSLERTYDMIVLLQATSPLRTASDIDGCIETCIALDAPACVTMAPSTKSPQHYFERDPDGRIRPSLSSDKPLVNRQDLPSSYLLNGAVYVARTDWLRQHRNFFSDQTVGHVMPSERSVDVDTRIDLALARLMLSDDPVRAATSS